MSSSPSSFTAAWPATPGAVLQLVAVSTLFWALASSALFLLAPGLDTFGRLLVFTECVGLTMVACVLGLRRMRRVARLPTLTRWLLIGIVSIPSAYIVGHQIAFVLLDEPIGMVGHQHASVVPIVFTVLAGGLGLLYYATREQLAREAAARSEAQRLALEAQLRLLRAQLDPHMLFNTLANLRSLLREDVDRAESMIDQLIVYLRGALAASQIEAVSLKHEFAQLRAYLDIMSLRMGPRLSYRLDLPAPLESTTVPPMLLQPLVENAIKHGLEPKVGSGRIDVEARATADGIEIRIADTGLGLMGDDAGADELPPAQSYGLQHVRSRLAAVYGAGARLTLERRVPNGVCAVVRIPG